MVRRLCEEDREETIRFLVDEASINLFIIGDIENYGFNSEFIEVWGSFNSNNKIDGILLRYYECYICYYIDGFKNKKKFKDIIRKNEINTTLIGKGNIIDELKDVYKNYEEKKTIYCELKSRDKLFEYGDEVKCAIPEDSEKILSFLNNIEEFSDGTKDSANMIKEKIKNKTSRCYYILDENSNIISMAQTEAENSSSAMVMNVATRRDKRGQGLVTKCLSKLCNDVILDSKSLCLFYLNPQAGSIYHRIGFKVIGTWTFITKK
ncbi:MAG: GNAT family N-acetyltransferase [Clostridium sp.]